MNKQELTNNLPVAPNYDLTPEELDQLQRELVGEVTAQVPESGMVAVWINPESRFANFVRNHEASYFPEVKEITAEEESNTTFLALVDTRPDSEQVVHGATITGGKDVAPEEGLTGFYTVDALIERGNFTEDEFRDYYQAKGINIDKSVAVETNFRINQDPQNLVKFNGIRTADLVYLAITQLLESKMGPQDNVGVFATLNKKQRNSFSRMGINYELLMGQEEMHTPEAELGVDSLPVFIPYDDPTQQLFSLLGVKLPEVTL